MSDSDQKSGPFIWSCISTPDQKAVGWLVYLQNTELNVNGHKVCVSQTAVNTSLWCINVKRMLLKPKKTNKQKQQSLYILIRPYSKN